MNLKAQMFIRGMVGMYAAVLFLIALFVEYAFGLFPPGDGSVLYYFDQALFFIAQIGLLFLLFELWRAKVAGDGIFGKISLGIFISALIALLIAQAVSLLANNPDVLLYPIGGVLQFIGCLLTGIAVVIAKRWEGWQRFVLWQVTWFLTGLALFTQAGRLQQGNPLPA